MGQPITISLDANMFWWPAMQHSHSSLESCNSLENSAINYKKRSLFIDGNEGPFERSTYMLGESTAPSISVPCVPVLDMCVSPRIGRTASAGTSSAHGATVSIKTLTLEVAQHLADTSARTGAVLTLPHICFLSTWTRWLPVIWLEKPCYGTVSAISQTL